MFCVFGGEKNGGQEVEIGVEACKR